MLWISRISLIRVLVISAFAELALNRIGLQLLPYAKSPKAIETLIDRLGLFAFYFTSILALIVFTWSVVIFIRDRNLFGPRSRVFLLVTAAAFLPFAAVGIVLRLPLPVALHLNGAFGAAVLAILFGIMWRPSSLRTKVGLVALAIPLLFHCYWLLTQHMTTLAPAGVFADLPSRVFSAGEQLLVANAFAMFFFFAPRPRRATLVDPIPLTIALLVTITMGFVARSNHEMTTRAIYYGLNMKLPPSLMGFEWIIYLSALFFFTITILSLMRRSPRSCATGSGLLLIAISGFHLQLPHQLLLTLVGLMQIVRSALRGPQEEGGAFVSTAELTSMPDDKCWTTFLARLGRACSDPDINVGAVILQNGNTKVARLRGEKSHVPFTLRVHIGPKRIRQFEVMIATPPTDDAPASITRVKERRGRPIGTGSGRRVRRFDSRFVMRDRSDRVADILSSARLRRRPW